MKKLISLIVVVFTTSLYADKTSNSERLSYYDPEYVTISSGMNGGEAYNFIWMSRKNDRVRAKYFAAPDYNGNNVQKRYQSWSKGMSIILVSSGAYLNDQALVEGLTIDNGVVVNRTLTDKVDGLVIVYATGGIAVTNLDNGDLTLNGGGENGTKNYDLRNSSWDLQNFINWSESQEATVFQTHLLVWKNKLDISATNSSDNTAKNRRFLAAGTDEDGEKVHVIIQCPGVTTLYQGTKKTFDFLRNFKDMNVTFMINLDPGYQDVFKLYNYDGTINNNIKGEKSIDYAGNLLVYYYL